MEAADRLGKRSDYCETPRNGCRGRRAAAPSVGSVRPRGDRRLCLLDLPPKGHVALQEERCSREGWLVRVVDGTLGAGGQAALRRAVELRRLT